MPPHPPSQLGLFDAPASERPEGAAREEAAPHPPPPTREEALPQAPGPSHRLPAREDAQPPTTDLSHRLPTHEDAQPPTTDLSHRLPAHEDAQPPTTDLPHRVPAREDALHLASDLARRLSAVLGVPVHLRLNDNRATLVSFRRGPEGLKLRVHHLFLGAPDEVVRAMARYAGRNDAAAREVLEAYAHSRRTLVRRERRPGKPLRSRGRCFDLHALFARLNATYFDGRVRVDIGWARKPGRARRRSIHLGGYDARLREIRIHPALDRPHVPAFAVDYLVFHAMLHADLAGPDDPGLPGDGDGEGRCAPEHTPAFLEREAAFPLRDSAQRWLADNLTSLMRG